MRRNWSEPNEAATNDDNTTRTMNDFILNFGRNSDKRRIKTRSKIERREGKIKCPAK